LPTSRSLTLSAQRPIVLLPTAEFHKHCWAVYGCSPPFLALLQGTVSQLANCSDCHWQTPFWRAAADVTSTGKLCKFVNGRRQVQVCATWYNSILAVSSLRKENKKELWRTAVWATSVIVAFRNFPKALIILRFAHKVNCVFRTL
jgi:hypothetical protein